MIAGPCSTAAAAALEAALEAASAAMPEDWSAAMSVASSSPDITARPIFMVAPIPRSLGAKARSDASEAQAAAGPNVSKNGWLARPEVTRTVARIPRVAAAIRASRDEWPDPVAFACVTVSIISRNIRSKLKRRRRVCYRFVT